MHVNRVDPSTGDPAQDSKDSNRLATLVEAVMSISSDTSLALQSLARVGADLSGADRGELMLSSASCEAAGRLSVDAEDSIGRRFGELLVQEDRPLLIADVGSESSETPPRNSQDHVQSFIGVPLRSSSSSPLVGTFCAFSDRPGIFTSAHLELWIALGWRVGSEFVSCDATTSASLFDERMLEIRRIGHSINNQLMVITAGADILSAYDNLESTDATLVEDMATAAETIGEMVSQLRSSAIAASESAT